MTEIKNIRKLIKEKTGLKCRLTKSRKTGYHRIEFQNAELDDIQEFYSIFSIEEDTRYSGKYQTIFCEINDSIVPCLIREPSFYINKNKIFKKKELTPQLLLSKKIFFSERDLIEETIECLWKKIKNEKNEERKNGFKLLLGVMRSEKYFFTHEEKIYKNNKEIIEQDFGEILCAIEYLKKSDINSLTFSENCSSAKYDFRYENKERKSFLINVKSGLGSGQSFKDINIDFIKKHSIVSYFNEEEKSILNAIDILNKSERGDGVTAIYQVARNFKKIDNILSKILFDISNTFFINGVINEKNMILFNTQITYKQYNEKIKNIIVKNDKNNNVRSVGMIKEETGYEKIKSYEELKKKIAHSISAIIAKYANHDILDSILNFRKNEINKVIISHVSFSLDSGIVIDEYEDYLCKFHYWGNSNNPTNNLLGFKTIKIK